MSSLPMPPPTHPATTTGHIPADSIGPLPPHLADIGTPERQRSPVGAVMYTSSPGSYHAPMVTTTTYRASSGSPAPVMGVSAPYSSPVAAPIYSSPGAPPAYSSPRHEAGGFVPAMGPTYEQEVQSFLDQTSPARIREQSPTTLPTADYMARANHESITNENSPARSGRGSYSGSPAAVAAPYMGSPAVGYTQPMTTSYAVPAAAAAPAYSHVMAGSPRHEATFAPSTGPTYEQEVQSYLDQTSPARIREQSPTNLPPSDYMARANHESVTNDNSPARTGRGGSVPLATSSLAGGGYVGTEYVPIVATSVPATHYTPPPAAPMYVTSGSPMVGPASPGIDAGSPAPPGGPVVPGEGESPRRIRAFGVPHTDPNDPGNVAASQRRYS